MEKTRRLLTLVECLVESDPDRQTAEIGIRVVQKDWSSTLRKPELIQVKKLQVENGPHGLAADFCNNARFWPN
jgi:hypothetical protein